MSVSVPRFSVSAPAPPPAGRVVLPWSKSVLIRQLAMDFLLGRTPALPGGPQADDVVAMARVVSVLRRGQGGDLDAGEATTVARFAMALAAATPGRWRVTGRGRLPNRPMKPLADALRQWGAELEWEGEEGRLPVRIVGREVLHFAPVRMRADVSSQFISALALPALKAEDRLHIALEGRPVSMPYLRMTLTMLERAGVRSQWRENVLTLWREEAAAVPQWMPERDWSAALFWVMMAVTAPEARLTFPDLSLSSLQGDAQVAVKLADVGLLRMTQAPDGLYVEGGPQQVEKIDWAMQDMPDAVLPLAAGLALRGVPFSFSGVAHLRHKESDRLAMLAALLRDLNMAVEVGPDTLSARPLGPLPSSLRLQTAHDHRMAMLAGLLTLKIPQVHIDDLDCVRKSFPTFWPQLRKMGWTILHA